MIGAEETVGLLDGCGTVTVVGLVEARFLHLSERIPYHCSPGMEHDPEAHTVRLAAYQKNCVHG